MSAKNFILPILITAFSAAGAYAQRSCNFAVTLVSPAEGTVIPAFGQFNVTVNIMNNGSADLLQGDTVWYNTPLMFLFDREPYVLTQGIASGESRTVTLTTLTNIEGSPSDVQENFCVLVESSPTADGAYTDPDLTNNTDCNEIIFKATPPTAIGDIDKNGNAKLSFAPNPASSRVTMTFAADRQMDVILQIRDLSGREIMTRDMGKVSPGNAELSVDIAGLAPGVYILELQGGGNKAIGKLVKQ